MKILSFIPALSFICSSFSCADSSAKNTLSTNASIKNNDKGFAVVELFTSEGCSSCPSADNAVATLLKNHSSNVYVLGYHVDYWNSLGWKDIFSSAAYTQAQQDYARAFHLSSVYTPQVVVNGTQQFVGSDENKLNAAVNKDLQQASALKLDVKATSADNKTVSVIYNTDATNAKLKIALIQLMAENKIQRGENSGATLHHVNIVRDIQTVSANGKGNVALKFPEGLSAKDCRVIAFAQNENDNKITAATEVNIE